MPKPAFQLPIWASNPQYLTGGKIGANTKTPIPAGVAADGHRPGSAFPTGGQHWNDWLNQSSLWSQYVDEANPLGAEDQHLVETNSDGETALARLDILGHSTIANQLVVAGGVGGVAVLITPAAAGFGVSSSGSSSATGIQAIQSGAGDALQGRNLGTGDGLNVESQAAATRAINMIVGTDATGLFIDANGGSATIGLDIDCDVGLPCRIIKTGGGLFPTLLLNGINAPQRGNLALSDQLDPSTLVAGDLWIAHGLNNFGRGKLRIHVLDGNDGGGAIGRQTVWTTEEGLGFGHDENGSTGGIVGTFTTVASVVLDLGQASPGKPTGKYMVWWSHSVQSTVSTDTWESQLELNTLAQQQDGGLFSGTNTEQRGDGYFVYTPTAGPDTLRIRVRRLTGSGTLTVDDAFVGYLGAFETGF